MNDLEMCDRSFAPAHLVARDPVIHGLRGRFADIQLKYTKTGQMVTFYLNEGNATKLRNWLTKLLRAKRGRP